MPWARRATSETSQRGPACSLAPAQQGPWAWAVFLKVALLPGRDPPHHAPTLPWLSWLPPSGPLWGRAVSWDWRLWVRCRNAMEDDGLAELGKPLTEQRDPSPTCRVPLCGYRGKLEERPAPGQVASREQRAGQRSPGACAGAVAPWARERGWGRGGEWCCLHSTAGVLRAPRARNGQSEGHVKHHHRKESKQV